MSEARNVIGLVERDVEAALGQHCAPLVGCRTLAESLGIAHPLVQRLVRARNALAAYRAWEDLGHVFHATQDFFAHSNYVELMALAPCEARGGCQCPGGRCVVSVVQSIADAIRTASPEHSYLDALPDRLPVPDAYAQFTYEGMRSFDADGDGRGDACDDDPCTIDTCEHDGSCAHTAVPACGGAATTTTSVTSTTVTPTSTTSTTQPCPTAGFDGVSCRCARGISSPLCARDHVPGAVGRHFGRGCRFVGHAARVRGIARARALLADGRREFGRALDAAERDAAARTVVTPR